MDLLYNLGQIQAHKLNTLQYNKILTHVPIQITCLKQYLVLQIDVHLKTHQHCRISKPFKMHIMFTHIDHGEKI
jgi:hypothetical protein